MNPANDTDSNWHLVAQSGPMAGVPVAIDGPVLVGRDASAAIRLASAQVSRRHAELWLQDGRLWVRDLNSSNGTFVNEQRITEQALAAGDVLRFEALGFVVGQTAARAQPTEPAANTVVFAADPAPSVPAVDMGAESMPVAAAKPTAPAAKPVQAPMVAPEAPVANTPDRPSTAPAAPSAGQSPAPALRGGLRWLWVLLVLVALALLGHFGLNWF